MLSQPMPLIVSVAISLSRRSYTIFLISFFLTNSYFTISMIPWLFSTQFYHIPSHPNKINSSSFLRSNYLTSGLHVIICQSYGNGFLLQSKSPKERVKLSPPLTLPMVITPPAFLIRAYSMGLSGLWSSERAIALPPRHRTERESPALATKKELGVMSKTLAVQPTAPPMYSFYYWGVASLPFLILLRAF